jgi:hypothetical protein
LLGDQSIIQPINIAIIKLFTTFRHEEMTTAALEPKIHPEVYNVRVYNDRY